MTMQVYTDPKLLDIAGALDALPSLPLHAGQESIADAAKATGTDDLGRSQFAPEFAPATDKSGQKPSLAVIMAHDDKSIGKPHGIDATSCVDKRKDPLTIVVNGSEEWSRRGSNPQPLECHSSALPIAPRPHGMFLTYRRTSPVSIDGLTSARDNCIP
jgi:hypothetical protein